MSDIELPEPDFSLDGGKTPCWYEHSLRAALLADREKRAQTAQEVDNTKMWAVHVDGPDDVHAVPDREIADAACVALNCSFKRAGLADMCRAEVIEWPHGYESWSAQKDQFRLEATAPTEASKPLSAEATTASNAGEALKEMEARKDAAYLERNQVVAALASAYPSGIARTAIEGWSEDWHSCVYIDLPTGQASWHYHDSQSHLFSHLPAYRGSWDGHTTDEKYVRLAALATQQEAPSLATSNRAAYDAGYEDALQAAGINVLIGSHHDATQQEAQPQATGPLSFNCANGCGACGVKLRDFVTHATQAQYGDDWVTVASEPEIVSTCCGSPVEVWDERKQDIVGQVRAAQAEPAGGDKEDADKYRLIRRGQHWSVVDAIGNTLRGDDLDAAVDAIRAARAAQQATGDKS